MMIGIITAIPMVLGMFCMALSTLSYSRDRIDEAKLFALYAICGFLVYSALSAL